MIKQVLNLGAGVQSTTVLLMSLTGELEPLDHVIFADTGWEPQAVYDHLGWLKEFSEKHGVEITIVSEAISDLKRFKLKLEKDRTQPPCRILQTTMVSME